jgi:predicted nucleic acid-binding protein
MSDATDSYVIDTSAAINLERNNRLSKLPIPGDWIILPSIVANELNPNFQGTPETTKKWILKGKTTHFSSEDEQLYKQLILNPAVDDGEAQAISIAHFRKATLVIDEKKNGVVWAVANSLQVDCIDSDTFWNKLHPRLPGL